MKKKSILMGSLFAVTASLPVHASNFSYSYIGVELGNQKFDEELFFENEVYKDLGFFGFAGSYQFAENFALSLSSSVASNEGDTTDLTEYVVIVAAHLPFAVSRSLDIVPFVGHGSVEVDACQFNFCGRADDSGLVYGVRLRTWVIPDQFELGVGYSDSSVEDLESVVSVSGALWFQGHHRVSLNHSVNDLNRITTVGYAFNW